MTSPCEKYGEKKKSHNSNIMEKSNNTIFRGDKARHVNP